MRFRFIRYPLVLLLLAGCTPLNIYYKPGVAVARLEADQLACEVDALDKAPVANQIRRTPPVYIPGRVVCDGDGNCYQEPGYWREGEVFTVDVNTDLRKRVLHQCMTTRGYAPASVPPCPSGVANAAPPGQTDVLPPLTDKSCVIRNRGGGWQIVNQG